MPNFAIFTSRTFWTIVLMFVICGGNAIVLVLPAGIQAAVMGIFLVAAVYFHINPSPTYNSPSSTTAQ